MLGGSGTGAEVDPVARRVELHRRGKGAALGGAGIGRSFQVGGDRVDVESKQTPRIKIVLAAQATAWPPTVPALAALIALVAEGTVPRAARLIFVPVRVRLATLAPVTAPVTSLPVVTDFDLSWREPTELFPRLPRPARWRRRGGEDGDGRHHVGIGESTPPRLGRICPEFAHQFLPMFDLRAMGPSESSRVRIPSARSICGQLSAWACQRNWSLP